MSYVTAPIKSRTREFENISAANGRVFNDRTNTFFDNVRKDESVIKLALKMAIKGMSIQAISDILEVSTSLLERQNLTFRQDNNRISRKTIGFSKNIRSLYNQMRFYCTHFNFCRDHRGLTKKEEKRVLEKKTPVEACGITKKKWKLTELLNYRCFKISTD